MEMKKFCYIFLSVLCWTFWQPLKAQDTLRVNLETALEIALSESPVIRIADREIERATYALRESRSGLWPGISASGVYNRTLKKQVMVMDFGGEPLEISVGTDNNDRRCFAFIAAGGPGPVENRTIVCTGIDMAVEKARSAEIPLY